MTQEEIAIRKPLWIAMSQLFLDTDVRLSYCYIASEVAAAPFTVEQLGAIFHKEVAPVAAPNLLVVAGEWTAFDEEWLVSRITERLEARLQMTSFGSVAREDWDSVVVLINTLRTLSGAERVRRLALWRQLSKMFLDRACEPMVRPEGWTVDALETVWRDEMWPSFGRSVDAYRKHDERAYPSKIEIEYAWRQFKNALS